jgi:hypothetical protein
MTRHPRAVRCGMGRHVDRSFFRRVDHSSLAPPRALVPDFEAAL